MPSSIRDIPAQGSLRDSVHRLGDALGIGAGLMAAIWLTRSGGGEIQATAAAAAIVLFYLLAEVSGLYRSWRGISTEQEVICAVLTWGMILPPLLTLGFATNYHHHFSRPPVLAWFVAAPALIVAGRLLIRGTQRWLRVRGRNTRRYAMVGVNELSLHLARHIESSTEIGLKLVGFFDDRPRGRIPAIPAELGQKVGDLAELVEQTRRGEIEIIYITFPMRAEGRIKGILNKLSDTTASVHIVPDFFVFELLHSRWTSIGGLPVVSVFESPFYGIDGLMKRGLDLTLATLLLVVLVLPMAAIALGVKLSSLGPVFFRQRRYGLAGREIRIWKFRTMRVCEDGAAVRQAQRDDARVTWFGGLLRSTSLDELPQLFNVVAGSMSLVGPRPHASVHNEDYRKLIQGYMLRHKVKPGITGLAQVYGCRGETDTLDKMEQRIQCDHQYIREWSLWLDVKILLKTALVVFSRQNAY
jgi:putative colanic acid biosynthesis UDP-glucose lipid carrier transferase